MSAIRVVAMLLCAGIMGCSSSDGASFACPEAAGDLWVIESPPPGSARILVDTVSRVTAFDPALEVYEVVGPAPRSLGAAEAASVDFIDSADDTFECTFPPPEFECPLLETTFSGAPVLINVESLGSCAGRTASYELEVLVDGRVVIPTRLGTYADGSEFD